MSIGGMDALISRASVGVVLKAPVISRSALFWAHSRVFLIYVDLLSQNAMLPYVAIGSTAPKYICLRYSWFIPLTELASIQRASVTLEAFEAAILTWSWNLR